MGYFQVRYGSRVVICDCRCFIRMATNGCQKQTLCQLYLISIYLILQIQSSEHVLEVQAEVTNSVWPDLAIFCHFVIFNVFGKMLNIL